MAQLYAQIRVVDFSTAWPPADTAARRTSHFAGGGPAGGSPGALEVAIAYAWVHDFCHQPEVSCDGPHVPDHVGTACA